MSSYYGSQNDGELSRFSCNLGEIKDFSFEICCGLGENEDARMEAKISLSSE